MCDVTSQVLVFYICNLEEMLLFISVRACTSSAMYFSSLRTQVSHRRIQFHSILTFPCTSEAVSLAVLPGELWLSPRYHPGIACVSMAVVHQKWHIRTIWRATSGLICSNMFIACRFLPLSSTVWGFLKRGNVRVVCRCKWRWLDMVSKGSVFGGVKLVQRERNGDSGK